MWNSKESASGWTCTTATSVPSSFAYSLKAIRRGSLALMKSTNPGTRRLSASSFPVFSLFVAMKMNGPAIELPPVAECAVWPGSHHAKASPGTIREAPPNRRSLRWSSVFCIEAGQVWATSLGKPSGWWSLTPSPSPGQSVRFWYSATEVVRLPSAFRRLSQGGNGDAAICGFHASSPTVRRVARSRVVDRARDAGDSCPGDHHRLGYYLSHGFLKRLVVARCRRPGPELRGQPRLQLRADRRRRSQVESHRFHLQGEGRLACRGGRLHQQGRDQAEGHPAGRQGFRTHALLGARVPRQSLWAAMGYAADPRIPGAAGNEWRALGDGRRHRHRSRLQSPRPQAES